MPIKWLSLFAINIDWHALVPGRSRGSWHFPGQANSRASGLLSIALHGSLFTLRFSCQQINWSFDEARFGIVKKSWFNGLSGESFRQCLRGTPVAG
ncbi:hypothetical protein [Rhodoferax sp.]